MATWRCVKQCGACCFLDPQERPDLPDYLSPADLELYLSLVGQDGWCIHYDPIQRECGIYVDRPQFCRVEPEVFQSLYSIAPEDLNDFAIECCHEHISDLYGNNSPEMERFNQAITQ